MFGGVHGAWCYIVVCSLRQTTRASYTTRVAHESFPQEWVPHKSLQQECPTRISIKSVPQECPTRVSRQSIPQERPTKVFHKSVPQESPTRVSHQSFPPEVPTRVFHDECRTRVPKTVFHKSVLQECRTKVFYKSVPQERQTNFAGWLSSACLRSGSWVPSCCFGYAPLRVITVQEPWLSSDLGALS